MNEFFSVTQSCLTLCNPLDYSTSGLPGKKENVISFPLLGPYENNLKCSLLISATMKMIIFLLDCL